MDLTTKDIIKILPFDSKFKIELLSQFEFLSPDQKFNIERILWDTYFALYRLKYNEKVQTTLLKAEKGEEKLYNELGERINEELEEEMQKELKEKIDEADLSVARTAMEKIVAEIRAAKKK